MDVSSGLACRYCGKKWFAHDIVPHEKNCRLKIVKLVDTLFDQYRICLKYPPENTPWPLPPKIPKEAYNAWAMREYQNAWQACQKCGRAFPPIALADHFSECSGEGKVSKSRQAPRQGEVRGTIKKGQMVLQPGTRMETIESIGVPSASSACAPRAQWQKNPPGNLNQLQAKSSAEGVLSTGQPLSHGNFAIPEQADAVDDRIECPRCGRRFAQARIAAHEKICTKLKHGPPPGKDEFQRREKTDAEWARTTAALQPTNQPLSRPAGKSAGKAAKRPVDPFEAAAMEDGRIQCRRCGRGFARERIEKHEQICKGLENFAIKAPPAGKQQPSPVSGVQASPAAVQRPGTQMQQKTAAKPPQPQLAQPAQRAMQPQYGKESYAPRPQSQPQSPPTDSDHRKPAVQVTPGSAKFCSECGTPFSGPAKFCVECGARRM